MTKYPFKVGERVRWEDPDDGTCSCVGTIVEITQCDEDFITDGDVIIIRQDSGGIVEALPCELWTILDPNEDNRRY
jgi:hypothetical protein